VIVAALVNGNDAVVVIDAVQHSCSLRGMPTSRSRTISIEITMSFPITSAAAIKGRRHPARSTS